MNGVRNVRNGAASRPCGSFGLTVGPPGNVGSTSHNVGVSTTSGPSNGSKLTRSNAIGRTSGTGDRTKVYKGLTSHDCCSSTFVG